MALQRRSKLIIGVLGFGFTLLWASWRTTPRVEAQGFGIGRFQLVSLPGLGYTAPTVWRLDTTNGTVTVYQQCKTDTKPTSTDNVRVCYLPFVGQ